MNDETMMVKIAAYIYCQLYTSVVKKSTMTCGELVKNTMWTTVQTSACCTPIEDGAGSVCVGVRPPLKIILFPVHRPGELMSAEWIHFFHISEIIFSSIFHISSIQRKKYIEHFFFFCGLPTGHNYGHPVDRKQTFFKGGLRGCEGSV